LKSGKHVLRVKGLFILNRAYKNRVGVPEFVQRPSSNYYLLQSFEANVIQLMKLLNTFMFLSQS